MDLDRDAGQVRTQASGAGNRRARPALLSARRARPSPTPIMTRCARRNAAIETPLSATRARRFAFAPRRRHRRRVGSPRSATRVPMLSLDNAFSDEDVTRFRRPHPPLPAPSRGRAVGFYGRAEDRRPLDVIALRRRRLVQRRDARRRHRGRRRHRQCPHA